jgi:SH3 domain protein
MDNNMKKLIILFCLFTSSSQLLAEKMYVVDELWLQLRSGPSNQHRIIKSFRSGTHLEVISQDADTGFTQVKAGEGLEGWVPTKFIQSKPIYKERYILSQRKVDALNKQLNAVNSDKTSLEADHKGASKTVDALQKQNQNLTTELKYIKKISADAISLDNKNQALIQENEEIKIEVDTLKAENDRLVTRLDTTTFWYAMGLLATGIFLGLVLPMVSRGKKTSSW